MELPLRQDHEKKREIIERKSWINFILLFLKNCNPSERRWSLHSKLSEKRGKWLKRFFSFSCCCNDWTLTNHQELWGHSIFHQTKRTTSPESHSLRKPWQIKYFKFSIYTSASSKVGIEVMWQRLTWKRKIKKTGCKKMFKAIEGA